MLHDSAKLFVLLYNSVVHGFWDSNCFNMHEGSSLHSNTVASSRSTERLIKVLGKFSQHCCKLKDTRGACESVHEFFVTLLHREISVECSRELLENVRDKAARLETILGFVDAVRSLAMLLQRTWNLLCESL